MRSLAATMHRLGADASNATALSLAGPAACSYRGGEGNACGEDSAEASCETVAPAANSLVHHTAEVTVEPSA